MPSSRIVDRVRMFDSSPSVKDEQVASDQVQQRAKSRFSSPGRAAAMVRSRHRHYDTKNRASPTAAVETPTKNMAVVRVPIEENRQDMETSYREEAEGIRNTMSQSSPSLPSPAKAVPLARRRVPRRSLSPSPKARKIQNSPPSMPNNGVCSRVDKSGQQMRVNSSGKASPSNDRSREEVSSSNKRPSSAKPPSPHTVPVQAMAARGRFETQRKSPSVKEEVREEVKTLVQIDQGAVNSTAARAESNQSPATIPKSPSTASTSARARALQNMRRHRRSPSPQNTDDGNQVRAQSPAANLKRESEQRPSPMSRYSSPSSPGRPVDRRESPTVSRSSTPNGSEKLTDSESNAPTTPQRNKSEDFKNRPALLVTGRTAARKTEHAQSPTIGNNMEQSPLRPKTTCLPSSLRALHHIGAKNRVSSPLTGDSPIIPYRHPNTASPSRAAAIRQQFEGRARVYSASLAPPCPAASMKSDVVGGGNDVRSLKRIVSPRQATVLRQVETRNHASPSATESARNKGSDSLLVDSEVPRGRSPRSEFEADSGKAIPGSPNRSPGAKRVKPPQSKYYSLYEKTLVDIQSKEKSPTSKLVGTNNGGGSRNPVVQPRSAALRRSIDDDTKTKSPSKTDIASKSEPISISGSSSMNKSRSRPLPVVVDSKIQRRMSTRSSPSPSREVSPVSSEQRPRSESSRSTSSPRPVVAENQTMRRRKGKSASPTLRDREHGQVPSQNASPKFVTLPITGQETTKQPNKYGEVGQNNRSADIKSQNPAAPLRRPVRRSNDGLSNASHPVNMERSAPSKYYTAYAQKMNHAQKHTSPGKERNVEVESRDKETPYSHSQASPTINDLTTNLSTSRMARRMPTRSRSPALWSLEAANVVMQEEKASSVASSTSTRSSLSNEELGIIATQAMGLSKISSADSKVSTGNENKLSRQSPLQQMHALKQKRAGTMKEPTFQNGHSDSKIGVVINHEAAHQRPVMQSQKAKTIETGSAFSSTKAADAANSKISDGEPNIKEPVRNSTPTRLFDRLSKADRYAARMKQRKGGLMATDAGKSGETTSANQVNGNSAASIRQSRREGMARAPKQASRVNREPADKSLGSEDSANRSINANQSRRQKARELARKFEQRKNDTQKSSKASKTNTVTGATISTSTQATVQPPYRAKLAHFPSHAHHQNLRSSPGRGSPAEGEWPSDRQKEQISPNVDSWQIERQQDRLTPTEAYTLIEQNFSPSRARHADDSDGADEPWQPDVSRSYRSPRRPSPLSEEGLANALDVLVQELHDHRDVSPSCSSVSPSRKTDRGDIKPGDIKPAFHSMSPASRKESMSPASRKDSYVGSPGTPESVSRFQNTRSKFESPRSQSRGSQEEGKRDGIHSSNYPLQRPHEENGRDGSPSFNPQFQRPQLYPDERRISVPATDEAGMWDIAHKAGCTRFDDTQYQEAMNPFALSSDYTSTSFHTFDESVVDQGPVTSNDMEDKPSISSDLGESGTASEEIKEVSDSNASDEPEEVPAASDEFDEGNVVAAEDEYVEDNIVASSDYDVESGPSDNLDRRQSASDDSAENHVAAHEKPDFDEDVSSTAASDVDNSMLMGEGFAEDGSNRTSSADEAGRSIERMQTVYSSSSSSHFSKSTTSKDEMAKTFSRYTVSSTMARLEPISDEDNIPPAKKITRTESSSSTVKQVSERTKSRLVQLTEAIESETANVQSSELQWPANASEDTIRWWQQNYSKRGEEKTKALKSNNHSRSPRITEKDDEDVFSGLEEDVKGEDDPGDHVGYTGHDDSSDEEQENQPQSQCRTPVSTRTRASSYYNGISLEEFASLPPPPPPPLPPPPPPPPRSTAVLQPKTMNQNSLSPIATGIDESKLAKHISSGISSSPGKLYGYSPRDRDAVETIEEEASESSGSSGPEEPSDDELSVDKSTEDEASDEGWVGRKKDREDKLRSGMTIDQLSGNKTPTSDITSSLISSSLQKAQCSRPTSVEDEIAKSESSGSEEGQEKSQSKRLKSLPTTNSGLSPTNSGEMGSTASEEDDGVVEDRVPEADSGNFKTKNSTAQNSPGAIFMNIGYSIVDSITTVCRMPESIPQMAECGGNNTTEDFFERARSRAADFTCRCAPDVINTQTTNTSFPFSVENSSAAGSYAGLNDSERRVWNDWEIRDKKVTSDDPPGEQSIQAPPRQPSPRQPPPHPAPIRQPSPRELTAESSESSSQNRIQHEQKRKLAQEQLLLHARKAKELEFPGQRAVSILTENTSKNPVDDVPKATETALSNTQRLVLERFSTMLRNDRVEVLKLNRHEKWQLRYLTVSREVSWIRGDDNPSDVGQCPQALLWFKTPHSKHGGVGSQGRGGFKFTQLLRIDRDTRAEPAVHIPKKLKAKFPEYVGVKITYAYEGGSRDLVFCLRDTAEARAFCTAMEIIREVVQREEKVLEAAATRSPSQNSSASSVCERPRTSPRLTRSPRQNGRGESDARKTLT